MEEKYAKPNGESKLELDVHSLFLPEDRVQLYLGVADAILKGGEDYERMQSGTKQNVAIRISKEDCLGDMVSEIDRRLNRIYNGAKIHKLAGTISASRFYKGEMESGELPCNPTELAVNHPSVFGNLFSVICKAVEVYGVKI